MSLEKARKKENAGKKKRKTENQNRKERFFYFSVLVR